MPQLERSWSRRRSTLDAGQACCFVPTTKCTRSVRPPDEQRKRGLRRDELGNAHHRMSGTSHDRGHRCSCSSRFCHRGLSLSRSRSERSVADQQSHHDRVQSLAALINCQRPASATVRCSAIHSCARQPPRTITKVARTTVPSVRIFWEGILPSLASRLSCCCAPISRIEL